MSPSSAELNAGVFTAADKTLVGRVPWQCHLATDLVMLLLGHAPVKSNGKTRGRRTDQTERQTPNGIVSQEVGHCVPQQLPLSASRDTQIPAVGGRPVSRSSVGSLVVDLGFHLSEAIASAVDIDDMAVVQ